MAAKKKSGVEQFPACDRELMTFGGWKGANRTSGRISSARPAQRPQIQIVKRRVTDDACFTRQRDARAAERLPLLTRLIELEREGY